MRISCVGKIAFGKLESGIREKCREDYNNHTHDNDSLKKYWYDAQGLNYIKNSDVVVLRDSGKINEDGHRIFALDVEKNDVLELKKPLYEGELVSFLQFPWETRNYIREKIGLVQSLIKGGR